mgnify:CR=1 FL=1
MRFLFVLFVSALTFGQDSKNISLLDQWQNNNLEVNSTKVRYNECWGFVYNSQEYAILGSTEATHFFKLTDANKLIEVDSIKGKHVASTVIHRDFKTYKNYAYSVCDEGNSSLQIIDYSYLPDSVYLVNEIESNFKRAHNLFIDTVSGLLFVCGPMHSSMSIDTQYKLDVYSLTDPVNPSLIWSADPTSFPYVHDCYVRNNIGYLNCGDDGLRVYDFSNPSNPLFIQNLNIYQDQGYNHQGWLSPDGKTYIFGDETNGKRLKKCSVDANHNLQINSYFGTNSINNSVPHNIMITNELAFVSYYNEGLRIYDTRNTLPEEIAHYDTYSEENVFKMNGAWGVYSELPSQRILVSDRQNGLFLFDFDRTVFNAPSNGISSLFPNPVLKGENITIKLNVPNSTLNYSEIHNEIGQKLLTIDNSNFSYQVIEMNFSAGIYFVKINYSDYLGDENYEIHKFIIH